jgi:tetratricopeptide (TPR) repeat protein
MVQYQTAGQSENSNGLDAKLTALAKLEALAGNVDAALALRKSNGLLLRAAKAWRKGRVARAAQLALEATQVDETNAKAYHILAMALEKMGHLYKALVTYEQAYKLDQDDPELLLNLGMLANKFKMQDVAEKLFRRYIAKCPDSPLGYNNLASIMSEMNRTDDAIEVLREAIQKMSAESLLWNTLATILAEEGRVEESLVFYREAIRLEPNSARNYHNLGYAYMHLGRIRDAIDISNEALEHVTDHVERMEGIYSRGLCRIHIGELEEGFKDYEVRGNKRFRGYVNYILDAPRWAGENLAGKKILVSGEQGLGDEIMFANVLPDLIRAVGADGKVIVAIEPRLVSLFARSFPQAVVSAYDDRALIDKDGNQEMRLFPIIKETGEPDYCTPMGMMLSHFRKTLEDFPRQAYLVPDPGRVEHFRGLLDKGGPGKRVGICWRSMMLSMKRAKYYSDLTMWGEVLKTPGVRFVNIQYGDCTKELEAAMALHGVTIETIEGHDLTKDIDGNAALAAALDLVISAPTAAAATAAAVGAEVWFVSPGSAWPQCGTGEYPWYRKTRAFHPEKTFDWDAVFPRVAAALRDFAGNP